jgi:twitching motility protein PilU
MEQAISYSETGHLCLSTLHASNARQAFERIINFFPETAHDQLYMDMAMNIRAIVAQRLLRGTDGKRVPAVEIMQSSPYIQELIQKREIEKINSAMEQNFDKGMQTFDQALYNLYKQGKISMEEALENADSRNNLSLRIRLDEGGVLESPDELHIADEESL